MEKRKKRIRWIGVTGKMKEKGGGLWEEAKVKREWEK